MKKMFSLLLMVACLFGFIGVVNAEEEEEWSTITDDVSFIENLITGQSLEGNNAATEFFNKYDVYYQYVKIDDTLYSNYLSDAFEGTSTGASDSVNALIPTVENIEGLGSWVKVESPSLAYADLEFDDTKKTGYIVAIAAVSKTDTSKIYVYRGVYEVTSSSTLASSYTVNYDVDTDVVTEETTETVTEENPNTGISDYAIYLVPLALIAGVVLMMRKSYA